MSVSQDHILRCTLHSGMWVLINENSGACSKHMRALTSPTCRCTSASQMPSLSMSCSCCFALGLLPWACREISWLTGAALRGGCDSAAGRSRCASATVTAAAAAAAAATAAAVAAAAGGDALPLPLTRSAGCCAGSVDAALDSTAPNTCCSRAACCSGAAWLRCSESVAASADMAGSGKAPRWLA